MLDVLQDMFFLVLLVVGFASSFSATLIYHRHHQAQKPVKEIAANMAVSAAAKAVDRPVPKAKQEMSKTERAAFVAGRKDVVDGWINWAKRPTDTERRKETEREKKMAETEEGRQRLEAMQSLAKMRSGRRHGYGYHYGLYESVSPMYDRDEQFSKVLGQVPTSKWSLADLREHISDISIYCMIGKEARDELPQGAVDKRLRLTAALITDRVDETYDPADAGVTAQYAYHEDHRVVGRYIEGRAKGTEDIMEAITAARTRSREIGAASNAIEAANVRHAAALAALRETNQPTATRDQHADYEAQVRAIEATTDPTTDLTTDPADQ